MQNSQPVCIQNNKFRGTPPPKKKKIFYIPDVAWKIGVLTKNIENSNFGLKYTNHNKHAVIESAENRKSSLIQIKREKCVKASKHVKNMFLTKKVHFSLKSQNAQLAHTKLEGILPDFK